MKPDQWAAVDDYFESLFIPSDPILTAALESSTAAGLPSINVSPNQGQLLHVLARSHNVRRILEIGTLGGYSTIWLARALPADGRLITLELDPKHAVVAQQNLDRAGVSSSVEIRVGRAIETLEKLHAEQPAPFDLVFIDADKQSTKEYIDWSLQLTRPGSLIIVDNVIRRGEVINAASDDERVHGMRRALDALAVEPRLLSAGVQTVGSKGYDGFVLAWVK